MGISLREQEQIFDRFYRVGNAMTSSLQGAGLGLYICRAIVEAHGGRFEVMSEEGRLGLSGPEVIETSHGAEEFDARDRALVWRTVGGKHRYLLGDCTRLVDDSLAAFRDTLIDLVGYRRYGHNEGDEPSFTQPAMYKIIAALPTVREKWAHTLVSRGVVSDAQAAEALKRALALAPDEPAVAQTLGEAYGRQGKFTEALAAFRSAVAADPEFAEGHNNLGTTLLRMGDVAGAEKELREAVRLRPESSAMQVNLATFLARRGAMPEARRRFDLALRLNPDYADGHSAYGAALAANREWPAARGQLEEAVRQNPRAPVPHHNLGVVLLEMSDPEGALRQFRTAVEMDPNYYEAHLKLGQLLIRRGQTNEAEPHLRKAAESPDPQVKQTAAGLLRK
jgi:Tfp pilus assembly protein PilF